MKSTSGSESRTENESKLPSRQAALWASRGHAGLQPSHTAARDVTLVFTELERREASAHPTRARGKPWMHSCVMLRHNSVVRALLRLYGGYECQEDRGCFMLAFHNAIDAVRFAVNLQVQSLHHALICNLSRVQYSC